MVPQKPGVGYEEFVAAKADRVQPSGFEAGALSPMLFPWQADIVRWACRLGRACIFADCGLGKTAMQLSWANAACRASGGAALILAPLAVASQTAREGEKFGIPVAVARSQSECPSSGVSVANYEMLDHFDLSAFAAVVLDESSILKSQDSKTRMALTEALKGVPWVLCCTATPAPNDQMELGNHAEIASDMTREEMLATFFTHDGKDTSKWRLKGHAEADFYRWMATWAVMISRPSDIGYPDEGFELPPLSIETHEVAGSGTTEGRLFEVPAEGLAEQRRARKESLGAKVEAIAEMVNASDGQWVVWCDYNDESDALAGAIPEAVEVKGSDSPDDMGNCRGDEEFWGQFSYLIPELYRLMMPGRSVCIHCMQLPTSKARDGYIGLRDFRGDVIRAFQAGGFIYHSEVTIWKNPVTAMQRTKALGLLHKTIRKDSSMSRQGIADYVVVMRKPGDNPEPISHTSEEFPVSRWQEWASPVWMDIRQSNTLNGRDAGEERDERHICPLQLDVIERCVGLWSNPGDYVLSPFGGIGSEGYQSLLMGRRYVGVELKPSYFRTAVRNLK